MLREIAPTIAVRFQALRLESQSLLSHEHPHSTPNERYISFIQPLGAPSRSQPRVGFPAGLSSITGAPLLHGMLYATHA